MRATLLIALLALAFTAAAEEKPKPKITKQIDKSSPVLMQSQGGNDETHAPSKAPNANHNSSRSNTGKALDSDDDGDSIPTKRCRDGKDDDCNSATPIARGSLEKTRVRQAPQAPANHNTTRSNKTSE